MRAVKTSAKTLHEKLAAKRRKPHWSRQLAQLNACVDAVRWAKRQPSYAVAWKRCPKAGWLAWLLAGVVPHVVVNGVCPACQMFRRTPDEIRAQYARPHLSTAREGVS